MRIMGRIALIIGIVLAATLAVQARAAYPEQDSTLLKRNTTYDPIDYSQVKANLDRASRKTLWQRVVERFRTPLIRSNPDKEFGVSGSVGIGYMRETGVMFSARAIGLYDKQTSGPLDFPSSISVAANVSVTGFYAIDIVGNNYFSDGKNRLSYEVDLSSLPIRFWGLGFEAADENPRTKYTKKYHQAKVRYMRYVAGNFWVGANLDFRYGYGGNFNPIGQEYLLQGGQSRRSATSAGVGIVAEYDSRDNRINTSRGLFVSLLAESRPEFLGDVEDNLWHITATVDLFQPVWQGGVVAVDLYGDLWSSATPWVFWPAVGGDNRMRGYYYGRYTDRKMLSAQAELRQHIIGPLSCSVWGGAASLFSSHKLFDFSELLPNGGLGLRIDLGKSGRLRVDYGFGRKSNELIISINEAF